MDAFLQDIRYGLRALAKNPGFTAVAVVTLALGIGVNTAIFSMVDALLLRPLPVRDPGQITMLAFQQKHGSLQNQFSIPEYRDMRGQAADSFSEWFAYQMGLDGLSVNGKSDRIITNYVSGNFFSALGLQPEAGRFILPAEGEVSGADAVIVLSYSYWKSRFAGDPSVVGSKVSVNGRPFTVAGVAPAKFHGLFTMLETQAYIPLSMIQIEGFPTDVTANRSIRNLTIYGRLRPGISLKRADAALAVVAQRLGREHPADESGLSLQAFPETLSRPNPDPDNTLIIIAALFLGLTALVLLLACANVANILLVRASVREREMAIRSALGADRAGLIRQLLTESLLLAGLGGAAGIFLGNLGSSVLGMVPLQTDLPLRLDFGLDWRVFAFSFGAALATGVVTGIVPALRASRVNLNDVLHQSGRGVVGGRNRFRRGLVMAQVAGSLMLLIIAGLFTRSLAAVQQLDLGFDPDHILNATMDPNQIGYDEAQGRAFYKSLIERARALPGVEAVSTSGAVPMGYYTNGDTLTIEGYQPPAGQPEPSVNYNVISPDYFRTLKISVVAGRPFTSADHENGAYAAIVNESMAKAFWPKQDAIGRSFTMNADPQHKVRVVGVARDSRTHGVHGAVGNFFYVPLEQHYISNSLETLQVRTTGPPREVARDVERIIASLAPDLPVFDVKTMREALYTLNGLLIYQIGAGLAAALGLLGLVLAAVGVYGVISYAASQQTHEIGVRMALGARPKNILSMMFREGLLIVGIGLVVGLGATFAAARFVGGFLMVSATDPVTYLSVSAILVAVALLACYIPARRAMRVDPMTALRWE